MPFERCGLFVGELVEPFELAVEAALAHRVADMERMSRKERACGLLEDEPRGALVDADAREVGDVHEADRHRGIYFVVELLDAVVHERREERVASRRQLCGHVGERGAHRHPDRTSEVVAYDFDAVCHKFFC